VRETGKTKIAISYRRADSQAIVGRIFDRLCLRFGRQSIFLDIDHIAVGADFRTEIGAALSASAVLLVVVGRKWVGPVAEGHTRIDDPHDWMRIEVETALRQQLPIIPVLVDGAQMPAAADLPPPLREFAYRNAAVVDSGQNFEAHIERLIRSIDSIVSKTLNAAHNPPQAAASKQVSHWDKRLTRASIMIIGMFIALGAVVGGTIYHGAVRIKSSTPFEPAPKSSEPEVLSPVFKRTTPSGQSERLETAHVPSDPTGETSTPPGPEVAPKPLAPIGVGRPAVKEVAEAPRLKSQSVRQDEILSYIDNYYGGECFSIAPITIGDASAALEGIGASAAPFEELDRAFLRKFGFEASIDVRQVTTEQCPAVNFLARLRGQTQRGPRLVMRSGASPGKVIGSIATSGMHHIDLLVVSTTGRTENVSHLLKGDGTFVLDGSGFDPINNKPQLFIAIGSDRAIEILRSKEPIQADKFFPSVIEEASRAHITLNAAASFFKR